MLPWNKKICRGGAANDTYRMYLLAKRDGVDFNLASIGDDFDVPYKGPFDKKYATLPAGLIKAVLDIRGRRLRQVTSTRPGAALETRTAGCYGSKCAL